MHPVAIERLSLLEQATGTEKVDASCYHHQCLGVLGEGLLPAAHASDGTIEAVTIDGHDGWYLGVQWHPEDSAETDPVQASIFRAFVDAAR